MDLCSLPAWVSPFHQAKGILLGGLPKALFPSQNRFDHPVRLSVCPAFWKPLLAMVLGGQRYAVQHVFLAQACFFGCTLSESALNF
jgi:hypothetical protein